VAAGKRIIYKAPAQGLPQRDQLELLQQAKKERF
jgi:hypothetical protein